MAKLWIMSSNGATLKGITARCLNACVLASACSNHPQHKLGAAIYSHGGRLIATGYNHLKTHPVLKSFNTQKTVHAEIHAILRARRASRKGHNNNSYGRHLVLCVVRVGRTGEFLCSRPCGVCWDIIAKSPEIAFVIYVDEKGKFFLWHKVSS